MYWNTQKHKINNFYRSEIGKLFLKLCHYFGYKLHIWQPDELTILLPTNYNDTNHYIFGNTPQWIVEDIKDQVSNQLEMNRELEFRCKHAGYIRVFWQENHWTSSRVFMYQDDRLFDNKESFIRNSKINELLNED